MNLIMEIHDSELTAVTKSSGVLELRLNAYIHKSEGVPGHNVGTGWYQVVLLFVANGSVEGEITQWPAELYDGSLDINGVVSENVIPIPLDSTGDIHLTLEPIYDEPIVVHGNHVHLELFQWVPTFIENFPGEPLA